MLVVPLQLQTWEELFAASLSYSKIFFTVLGYNNNNSINNNNNNKNFELNQGPQSLPPQLPQYSVPPVDKLIKKVKQVK